MKEKFRFSQINKSSGSLLPLELLYKKEILDLELSVRWGASVHIPSWGVVSQFHEKLWSEGLGAKPLPRVLYEQVKQTKQKGKNGRLARPKVRLPELCPFQMKYGSSDNRSHVADRVSVLQLGVKPEPLKWESWFQDIGPPEASRPHVISVSETSPRDHCLNTNTQLHSMTSKLQGSTPHAKKPARQEHNPTH